MKFIGIQQLILRSFQQSRSSQNVPKQHNQKEEGTPKSDPELMKLKNSNMERSDLLCPVKKVHIQFMGRKTLTVLKWHQTSIVEVVHFPEPSSCILRHYISPFFVWYLAFSLFLTFSPLFVHISRGVTTLDSASSSSYHRRHVATVKPRELQDVCERGLVKATGSDPLSVISVLFCCLGFLHQQSCRQSPCRGGQLLFARSSHSESDG